MVSHPADLNRDRALSTRARFVIDSYLQDHHQEMLRQKVSAQALSIHEAYALLKDLSRDPKTGMQRADLLKYALEYEIQANQHDHRPLTVGIFDIDEFKAINSELNHVRADEILKQIADLIKHSIRISDDILPVAIGHEDESIIRWGGEEFVVIFAGVNLDKARIPAERIRQKIDAAFIGLRPSGKAITISGGLTQYDKNRHVDWKSLLESADQQLFRAKTSGRNKICF